jgi:membrane protease YdiL (CAAX protease family)
MAGRIRDYLKKHSIATALTLCVVDAFVLFFLRGHNPDSVTEGMAPRLLMIIVTGFSLWWLGFYKTAGLKKQGFLKSLRFGLILVLIALLILVGSLRHTSTFLGIGTLAIYTINMLLVGLHEELLMRGFVLNVMLKTWNIKKYGILWAVLASSGIFGLMHFTNLTGNNTGSTIAQAVYAMFIGIFFASIFVRTKNLYGLILLHSFVDWCFFFGTECFHSTGLAPKSGSFTLVLGSVLFLVLGLVYLRKIFHNLSNVAKVE